MLSILPGAVSAQLNQSCTISILNRSVQANADGSWILPNVPANFGPVRARATCVRNGVTTSGESAPFTVPTNGVVNFPQIQFGQITPIPTALALTAPTTRLTAVGQTTQLTVTARYSDGSTLNVTGSSNFTQYTVSNPAIVTVSPDGLAQAVASGTVLIQATHEGATGMATINVVLQGTDSDGDGIPDEWELAHGMNPNDPTDASEDFDHDGLTNLQEYLLGTDPRNPDTDGDGLSDGDEVARGTNPLLTDTDGDGISDGLEVQVGSNPLNPFDANQIKALKGIAVTPSDFILTFNTVVGDAYEQLKVTATLLDGRTIDATTGWMGTRFDSSDLTLCNFGSTAGRVYAGLPGHCRVTATVGAFTSSANIDIHTFSPKALSALTLDAPATGVDVNGSFVYLAVNGRGLEVIDVSNALFPAKVATLSLAGSVTRVRLAGNRAYVAAGAAGLHVVDITDPGHPALLATVKLPVGAAAVDVRVQGDFAYVAAGPFGLQVIDLRDPGSPRITGAALTAGPANGLDIEGRYAVVAEGATGVQVVDVADPAHPVVVGTVDTPGDAQHVVVMGKHAYVADFTGSLRVIDITTPSAPTLGVATPGPLGGYLHDVATADRFIFGADEFFVNGVPIIDVTDPNNPVARARLDFQGDTTGRSVAADGAYLYMVGDNGVLYIGQYKAFEDTRGIAPTVTIAAPTAGTTFVEGETIPVTVQATDDIAVTNVSLLVNRANVATVSALPYRFSVAAPSGATTANIGATAADLGGNIGRADEVVVNVIPDPMTTVIGAVVDQTSAPAIGVAVSTVGGRSTATGSNGLFSMPDVPTVFGDIIVRAITTAADGSPLTGGAGPVPRVLGGVTDVGVIKLGEGLGKRGNPAKSCLQIMQAGAQDIDRKYWIEVPSGVYEMYCNFTSAKGGWTRVGALDGSQTYCTATPTTDMRSNPDAGAGKIPDTDVQAILTGTSGSPHDLMYFIRDDNRFVWHSLGAVSDFNTSSRHISSAYYCPNWHCDDGTLDASVCGTEGDGCPVTAHGSSGFSKKIYPDSSFAAHIMAFHSNGGICKLNANYTRGKIWVYVR